MDKAEEGNEKRQEGGGKGRKQVERRQGEVARRDKETAGKEKKQEHRREGEMTRREEARI